MINMQKFTCNLKGYKEILLSNLNKCKKIQTLKKRMEEEIRKVEVVLMETLRN